MNNAKMLLLQNELNDCKTNHTLFFMIFIATIILAVFTAGAGLILTAFLILVWIIASISDSLKMYNVKKKIENGN